MTVLEELKVPPVLERQAAPPQSVGLPLPVVSAPVSQPVFVEPELLATAVEPVQTLLPGEASQPPVEVEPLVVAAPLRRADGSVADLGQPVLTEMLPPDSIPVPEGLPQVTIAAPSTVEIDAAPSVASLEMVEPPPLPEEAEAWSEEVFAAVLGQDMVAAVVAQPDIPQELRPSGVPIVRPGRIAGRNTAVDESLLLASLPEPRKNVVPPGPPKLLPEPEPEPGIVYVVPFIAVMVPDQVNARVFDQFVDNLNSQGDALGLQFVILKEGLQRVSPHWLAIRRYVTGELYAYVEDSGCCSTDLRTKARLTYHHPNQEAPAFGFEYPVRKFFEHDRSSLDIERLKLADDIAENLSRELLKALQN